MATQGSGNKQELRAQASTTHLYLHRSVPGNIMDDEQKDCKSQNREEGLENTVFWTTILFILFGHTVTVILNSQQLSVTALGLHESGFLNSQVKTEGLRISHSSLLNQFLRLFYSSPLICFLLIDSGKSGVIAFSCTH